MYRLVVLVIRSIFFLAVGLYLFLTLFSHATAPHIGDTSLIIYTRQHSCVAGQCLYELAMIDATALNTHTVMNIPPQTEIDSISWSRWHRQFGYTTVHGMGLYDVTHHLSWRNPNSNAEFFFEGIRWSRHSNEISFLMFTKSLSFLTENLKLQILSLSRGASYGINVPNVGRAASTWQARWANQSDQIILAIPNINQLTPDGSPYGLYELVWLDPLTGEFSPLASETIFGVDPSLSTNDTMLVYRGFSEAEVFGDTGTQIFVLNLETMGDPIQITDVRTSFRFPQWAIQDRAILYRWDSQFVMTYLESRETVTLPITDSRSHFDVSPDGNQIVYMRQNEQGVLALCVMHLETFLHRCYADTGLFATPDNASVVAWSK